MVELGFELGLAEEELAILIVGSAIISTRRPVHGRESALQNTHKEALLLKGHTRNISKRTSGAKFRFCHLGLSFLICK